MFLREVDCEQYAWLRIGLAACIFHWLCNLRNVAVLALSDQGFETIDQIGQIRPDDLNNHFSLLFHFSDAASVLWMLHAGMILAVLFGLGLATPVTHFLLLLIVISFRNRIPGWLTDGGTALVPLTTFLLLGAPTWKRLSLDALILRKLGVAYSPKSYCWILSVLQFQLCEGYCLGGYYKLMGGAWVQGSALETTLANANWSWMSDYVSFWWVGPVLLALHCMTWSVIVLEFCFPWLVLYRRTRPFALAAGIMMHLGIGTLMEVGTFPAIMVVNYLAFINPSEIYRTLRARGLRGARGD